MVIRAQAKIQQERTSGRQHCIHKWLQFSTIMNQLKTIITQKLKYWYHFATSYVLRGTKQISYKCLLYLTYKRHYQGIVEVLVIYDITKEKTLHNVKKQISSIEEQYGPKVLFFLWGAEEFKDTKNKKFLPMLANLLIVKTFLLKSYLIKIYSKLSWIQYNVQQSFIQRYIREWLKGRRQSVKGLRDKAQIFFRNGNLSQS